MLPANHDNPATIEDGSDNAMRRQLVQVLMRDVLRKHGIPSQWIECQMLVVSSRSRGPGLYARLVIKHWDERLMTYAFAFQRELLTDIARFEPKASVWLHGISWQLEMDDTYPYTTLPDKAFWQEPAKNPPKRARRLKTVMMRTKTLKACFSYATRKSASRLPGATRPLATRKRSPSRFKVCTLSLST
ncbi:hypothetical protein LP417_02475 [Polaromonas sp. P1-6]|nr:hypothetical protein LP417_02475 [Polaromonas sp. P1-6]UUZ68886.1 hypothetical protein LP416_03290 [Polaromonas sp. P2-4]